MKFSLGQNTSSHVNRQTVRGTHAQSTVTIFNFLLFTPLRSPDNCTTWCGFSSSFSLSKSQSFPGVCPCASCCFSALLNGTPTASRCCWSVVLLNRQPSGYLFACLSSRLLYISGLAHLRRGQKITGVHFNALVIEFPWLQTLIVALRISRLRGNSILNGCRRWAALMEWYLFMWRCVFGVWANTSHCIPRINKHLNHLSFLLWQQVWLITQWMNEFFIKVPQMKLILIMLWM